MPKTSFLPEDYVEKRAQWRANMLNLALFLVVMGAVVGAFFVTDRQGAEVRKLQKQVQAEFETAAKRIEQLDQLQRRKDQMVLKARITSQLGERVPRRLILSELVNNMPLTMGLLELDLTTRAVPVKTLASSAMDKAKAEIKKKAQEQAAGADPLEVKPVEASLKLVGIANDDKQVADFMTAIGQCPLFTDINLAFTEEMALEGHPLRKFRIEMKLAQDVEVQKMEPRMVRRGIRNPMAKSIVIEPGPAALTSGDGKIEIVPIKDNPQR